MTEKTSVLRNGDYEMRYISLEPEQEQKPEQNVKNHILLIMHGGCFVSGDETWQKEQAMEWTNKGQYITVRFNFRKTNWKETLSDVKAMIHELKSTWSLNEAWQQ